MNWRTSRIAIIDTETCGTDPCVHRVVELGAVILEAGAVVERFSMLFNPGCPIPAEATAVHGISDADVQSAPPFAEFASEFSSFVSTAIPAGYNWRFDRAMVVAEFLRAGVPVPPELHANAPSIDILAWVRAHDPYARGTGRHKLTTVAQRLGVELGTAHRAVGDCETAARLLVALQNEPMHRESGVTRIPDDIDELMLHQRRLQHEKDADFAAYVIRKRNEERKAANG